MFQKQYPVSATLLVLSTMPSKNVYRVRDGERVVSISASAPEIFGHA